MAVFTGENVEKAIEAGLNELDIPRLKARIRVISKEKKGILGFGRKLAQVEIVSLEEAKALDRKQRSVTSIFKDRPKTSVDQNNKTTVFQEKSGPSLAKQDDNSPCQVSTSEQTVIHINSQSIKDTSHGFMSDSQKAKNDDSLVISSEEIKVEQSNPSNHLVDEKTISTTVSATLSVVSTESNAIHSEQPISSESLNSENILVYNDLANVKKDERPEQVADAVTDYVQNIIYEMDIEASIETKLNHRQISLQIETAEPGRVIGYHGKILKSLQLLAQNYLHDHYSRHFSVSINVHDYVEHRTETLIDLTHKVSKRVLETGESYRMDPMSNSERKIIHKTIANIDGVVSHSQGDDPDRYVVVSVDN